MERFNSIEDNEREYRYGRLKDFFILSELEKEFLKEEIEKSGGLIRIFVHPYYEDPGVELSDDEKMKVEEMQKTIKKILVSSSDKAPPIFLMEEACNVGKLRDRLKEFIENKVYIIPTYPDTSEPKFVDTNPEENDGTIPKENWRRLIGQFKLLGIKRIIIGGMNLEVSLITDKEGELQLNRCVGEAITNLKKDFEIEISNLTFLENRTQYKEAKKTLRIKQESSIGVKK